MGKRGPKKGEGGRPQGSGVGNYRGKSAKSSPELRGAWRTIYYLRKGIKPPSTVLYEPSSIPSLLPQKKPEPKRKK